MADPFGPSGFDRRDFLRLLSNGTLLLASGGLLAGCGGGGGSSSGGPSSATGTQNLGTPVFSQTQQATAAGTQVTDATHGIALVVPPNTLSSPASVSLQVFPNQRTTAASPGFTNNPNAVNVTIDPSALAAGSTLQVQIPLPTAYDPFGSMMFVTDDLGNYIPMLVSYDSSGNLLTGSVTAEQLQGLASAQASGAARPRVSVVGFVLGIFVASVARVVESGVGDLYKYVGPTGFSTTPLSETSTTAVGSIDRIAVVVHGFNDTPAGMATLAGYLLGGLSGPDGISVYSDVWAFGYDWKAPISENGALLAARLNAAVPSGVQVDIYAHSMGGLVSRWALEQAGLGSYINRLVTLGTPHAGVPLQVAQSLAWFLAQNTGINAATIIPGVNDLVANSGTSASGSSFLTQLNGGSSPYANRAEYFTLAGTNHDLVFGVLHVGTTINSYYNHQGTGAAVQDDGIIPVASAESTSALSNKSDIWASDQTHHTATLPLNHNLLRSDSSAFAVLQSWINSLEVTIQ